MSEKPDIVERLRNNTDKYPGFQNLNTEAAAEIERLRAALTRVLDAIKYSDSSVLIDDNFNPNSHVDIVLTVAECQAIRAALNPPA